MEELKHSHNDLSGERSSVKERFDGMVSAFELKKSEMKEIDDIIRNKTDEINEKQLEIYAENEETAQHAVNVRHDEQKAEKLKKDLDKVQVKIF